jgi:hypothetical protein
MEDCEDDIRRLKLNFSKGSSSSSSSSGGSTNNPVYAGSPGRNTGKNGGGSNAVQNCNSDLNYEELKSLKKKVKKLAENTTKACSSLSSGLSEVQHATLHLYTWVRCALSQINRLIINQLIIN